MAQMRGSRKRNGPYVAGNPEKTVFLVTSREDADALAEAAFPAVAEWTADDANMLRGKYVYILTGEEWAARTLYGVAEEVYLLEREPNLCLSIERCGREPVIKTLTQICMDAKEWEPRRRPALQASEFGEDDTRFLWYPYLPLGDYSVMMAEGGTGKTLLCCLMAAFVSSGRALPGEEAPDLGRNVLYISAEDSGEILKKRLASSGADLERVSVLDRCGSLGLNIADGFDEFAGTVLYYRPALVIIDPWHAFIGDRIDICRANVLRPVLQKLSNLARRAQCAIVLISHVNKRAQGENANNAATGSADLINASRSAFRVIFDEEDKAARIMVHTKSNYAPYGQSIRYRFSGGGVCWDGFSEITRQTLEAAARGRATPGELLRRVEKKREQGVNTALLDALKQSVEAPGSARRFTYDEFRGDYGEDIFDGDYPKYALDAVRHLLQDEGIVLKTGLRIRRGDRVWHGFSVRNSSGGNGSEAFVPNVPNVSDPLRPL